MRLKLGTIAAAAVALAAGIEPACATPTTTRMSCGDLPGGWRQSSGNEGIGESVAISTNGRYVAFVTNIQNVYGHDSDSNVSVIAVRDTQTGTVSVASVSLTGEAPNGPSFAPTVTPDGRYVSFCSWASNLIANDTNGQGDVFVRDMQTNTTRLVNVPYDGIYDQNEKTYCVCHSMTDDGRYVAFTTASSHVLPGNTSNTDQVYVRDMVAGQTYLISVAAGGGYGNESSVDPRVAANGRYVTFVSVASNLVANTPTSSPRAYVRDTATATTTLVGDSMFANISPGGRYVVYTSMATDSVSAQTYRYDRQTSQSTLCSVAPNGATPGNRDSMGYSVSDDGRYVCFTSKARNLVVDDTNDESDVFIRDLGASPATTTRVSVAKDGLQGNRGSGEGDMSADGNYVAFASASEDLVSYDFNNQFDVFLRGPMLTAAPSFADAVVAAGIAGGLTKADSASLAKLNVVKTGASATRVDIQDIVGIARAAAGLN